MNSKQRISSKCIQNITRSSSIQNTLFIPNQKEQRAPHRQTGQDTRQPNNINIKHQCKYCPQQLVTAKSASDGIKTDADQSKRNLLWGK